MGRSVVAEVSGKVKRSKDGQQESHQQSANTQQEEAPDADPELELRVPSQPASRVASGGLAGINDKKTSHMVASRASNMVQQASKEVEPGAGQASVACWQEPQDEPRAKQQYRCYLCETPKQDYSLIRTFSETVCRGCVNYEGPDRIEQLIAEARGLKSGAGRSAVGAGPIANGSPQRQQRKTPKSCRAQKIQTDVLAKDTHYGSSHNTSIHPASKRSRIGDDQRLSTLEPISPASLPHPSMDAKETETDRGKKEVSTNGSYLSAAPTGVSASSNNSWQTSHYQTSAPIWHGPGLVESQHQVHPRAPGLPTIATHHCDTLRGPAHQAPHLPTLLPGVGHLQHQTGAAVGELNCSTRLSSVDQRVDSQLIHKRPLPEVGRALHQSNQLAHAYQQQISSNGLQQGPLMMRSLSASQQQLAYELLNAHMRGQPVASLAPPEPATSGIYSVPYQHNHTTSHIPPPTLSRVVSNQELTAIPSHGLQAYYSHPHLYTTSSSYLSSSAPNQTVASTLCSNGRCQSSALYTSAQRPSDPSHCNTQPASQTLIRPPQKIPDPLWDRRLQQANVASLSQQTQSQQHQLVSGQCDSRKLCQLLSSAPNELHKFHSKPNTRTLQQQVHTAQANRKAWTGYRPQSQPVSPLESHDGAQKADVCNISTPLADPIDKCPPSMTSVNPNARQGCDAPSNSGDSYSPEKVTIIAIDSDESNSSSGENCSKSSRQLPRDLRMSTDGGTTSKDGSRTEEDCVGFRASTDKQQMTTTGSIADLIDAGLGKRHYNRSQSANKTQQTTANQQQLASSTTSPPVDGLTSSSSSSSSSGSAPSNSSTAVNTYPQNSALKCIKCLMRLEDLHFVQCPSVTSHKFCFGCSRKSILEQRSAYKLLPTTEGRSEEENRIFCPSGKKCSLANEQSPWTFMNNEIETIFRDRNASTSTPLHHHHHHLKETTGLVETDIGNSHQLANRRRAAQVRDEIENNTASSGSTQQPEASVRSHSFKTASGVAKPLKEAPITAIHNSSTTFHSSVNN